jgi:hypothetical protein
VSRFEKFYPKIIKVTIEGPSYVCARAREMKKKLDFSKEKGKYSVKREEISKQGNSLI